MMHFWELCLMKNTLFLKKNGEKIRFFIAFSAIFRDFCEIEKNSQVQIFSAFLGVGCNMKVLNYLVVGQY